MRVVDKRFADATASARELARRRIGGRERGPFQQRDGTRGAEAGRAGPNGSASTPGFLSDRRTLGLRRRSRLRSDGESSRVLTS